MAEDAIDRAVRLAGGQSALAKICGVSQPSVWGWHHRSRQIPAEFVLIIERELNIPRFELRPDIYPPDEYRAA